MTIDWKSDQGLTLTLLDAQRGLIAAHSYLTGAIEELNSPAPDEPDGKGHRNQRRLPATDPRSCIQRSEASG